MAGDTTLTVIGNLVDDPELKFTPSGAAVSNFTVASTPRSFDKNTNEWKDGDTLFLRCAIWRQAAENVAESLTKGMRVIVTGKLRCRPYETREGEKRQSWEVDVDEVGPSLLWASAKVTRTERSGAPQQQQQQRQPQQSQGQDPWATPGANSPDPWATAQGGQQQDQQSQPPF